jgi:P27 family predicted phage terminase small subunit
MAGTSSSGGRNRRSRAEHALAGTGRKDRGTSNAAGEPPEQRPDPPKGRPSCPPTLRGQALAEWTRMVDRLDASKTLSRVDDAALYQYCCLFAETEAIAGARARNERLIAKLQITIARLRHGDDIVKAMGHIVALKKLDAKHLPQLRQGHMAIRQYLVEFGMTPAARGRVAATASEEPVDPFKEFDDPAKTQH